MIAILIASLSFGAGASLRRDAGASGKASPNQHLARRMAIESQARQGRYDTVVFGDSIVEFAAIDTFCGKRVLNAGLAGARIEDVLSLAPSIVQTAHPAHAIVAVGINDAARQFRTGALSFAVSYEHLMQYLRSTGVSLQVAMIAPIGEEIGASGGPYDAAYRSELNDKISALAREFSLSAIPFDRLPRTDSGALAPELTTDGVHLSAEGYDEWQKTLARHICGRPER
ncbi:MAG: hypothetical protein JOZ16_15940 [Methylobacteriaceae bacterium]|nr:hypothetical protein [Methylobacteriaceae bacterium]